MSRQEPVEDAAASVGPAARAQRGRQGGPLPQAPLPSPADGGGQTIDVVGPVHLGAAGAAALTTQAEPGRVIPCGPCQGASAEAGATRNPASGPAAAVARALRVGPVR